MVWKDQFIVYDSGLYVERDHWVGSDTSGGAI